MKDPEVYLTALGIEVPDVFDPDRTAILDLEHRFTVNHDAFFFADAEGVARFRRDPLTHAGILRDPVSMVRFRPGTDSPKLSHGNRLFVFSADSTRATFAAHPDSFSVPMYGMIPREKVADLQ